MNIKHTINTIKTKLPYIFVALLLLWSVFLFIPETLVLLIDTFLGKCILITAMALVFVLYGDNVRHYYYGVLFAIALIILYRFGVMSRQQQEPFTSKSERDFILIQHTINPHNIFDMNVIQNQASQEELDYFNKHAIWPWSKTTTDLYVAATNKNPYIRTYSKDAVNYAQKIYNEAAILELLSNQTREGQFAIDGILVKNPENTAEQLPSGFGAFPYTSGLMADRTYDEIKCNYDHTPGSLQRKTYTGKGGIFNEQTYVLSPVDYNQLETIIPGFTFTHGPCNPCGEKGGVSQTCSFRISP